jgi:hypothetical protein
MIVASASGHSRRILRVHATSGYPPKLTVKADVAYPLPWARFKSSLLGHGTNAYIRSCDALAARPEGEQHGSHATAQSRAHGWRPTGRFNAITDVAGVKVGYFTLIRNIPAVVRTGITAIWPRGPEIWTDHVFAGTFSFNGNGEMTGLPWIAEQGTLGAPIGITNTYQVGIVRDAICALAVRDHACQDFLSSPRRSAASCNRPRRSAASDATSKLLPFKRPSTCIPWPPVASPGAAHPGVPPFRPESI